jgi:MYXO-CTERM domain-containing protein
MKFRNSSCILALLSSATMTMGALTGVTNLVVSDSPNLREMLSLTAGGNTFTSSQLSVGTSFAVTNSVTISFPLIDDGYILSTGHGNVGNNGGTGLSLPVRTVLFGGNNFTSIGTPLDFFIFELGAANGDSISVAPIFANDSLGQNTAIATSNWGNSGLTGGGSFQGSQFIWGVGFAITDLLDGAGSPLLPTATIKGIAITAGGGVDPVGIYAVTPVPEPTTAAMALLGLGGLALFRKRL